ncbi:tRNA (adenosine(37)-N6)-threonylcarbamoyltransferase complex ATPase subunit type 1 TsaE [Leucobacter chinensis]|uniref:tRNA (adenosine(37)-N6)-threonylcarbamoyltransferase complex ATPase subunit type 1 TsaE n=1 Tax=Leucobacter chinensis TaxID=2851010 RepID=UPI001C228825|nr:tRNA (adenosine(37)-N6)-threonylcarbamoyltransferase complex ATPase subunit type 1 TsaE [Leucobacter chinensis]
MQQATWRHEAEIATPEAMHDLGVAIGETLKAGDVVMLTGALGAGKTTLTRGIGQGMGVRGQVTSPTFVLARTHPSLVGGPELVHVDAYRLGGPEELDDLDLDFEHAAVVIEWGKGMIDDLPNLLEITLTRQTGAEVEAGEEAIEARGVLFEGYGERWKEGITW